jgi:hypothetical protein
LTVRQVLAWADAHFAGTRRWPSSESGPVSGAPGETWRGINQALANGYRGLPGGSSLARLLTAERGKRHKGQLPRLAEGQILAWANLYYRRRGKWPTAASGPVADAPGETWAIINGALQQGHRGLPGRDTLARLLDRHRRRGR